MDPEFLKTIGFTVLVLGLIGEIGVLFIPHHRRKLEKSRDAYLICTPEIAERCYAALTTTLTTALPAALPLFASDVLGTGVFGVAEGKVSVNRVSGFDAINN